MKKLFLVIIASAIVAACDNESSRHAINLSYPLNGQYGVVYADQPEDTIIFNTFDSYRATTNETWISIDPGWAAVTIQNDYWNIWEIELPLTFKANTTGETRDGIISINNYGDDWNETISVAYLQLGWLNVSRPQPNYGTYSDFPRTATFELTDSAAQVSDTLEFTVHGDWTLTSNASFVAPEAASGSKGENKVALNVEKNDAASERSATLTLTSSGVETPIILKQQAKKEE